MPKKRTWLAAYPNTEDWFISPYDERLDDKEPNASEYRTFRDAKRDMLNHIKETIEHHRAALRHIRKLKAKDCK